MIHIKNTTASYVLLNSSKELHMKENLNIDGEKNMKILSCIQWILLFLLWPSRNIV